MGPKRACSVSNNKFKLECDLNVTTITITHHRSKRKSIPYETLSLEVGGNHLHQLPRHQNYI